MRLGIGYLLSRALPPLESDMVQSAAGRIKAKGWNAEAVTVDAQVWIMHFLVTSHISDSVFLNRIVPHSPTQRKLGITTWTSPGWLKSITSLLSATGFTHIDAQYIKFEHTDSMPWYLRNMKIIFPKILPGDAAEKYDA
ncbi:hypothetical protein C8R44DRAFT_728278 [Mycena epipterygia]|nr:hypothetical protein C8R44DRAFT_728278 [Mycena epipterygia]